jgi:hypothetical protein
MPPYKAQELHDRNELSTPSLQWGWGGGQGTSATGRDDDGVEAAVEDGGACPAPCQPPAPPPPYLPVSFSSRRRYSAALTPLMVIVSALGRSLLQNTWLRYSSPAFRVRRFRLGEDGSRSSPPFVR